MSKTVEELVQLEPWRAGQGQGKSALDPAWDCNRETCAGKVVPENGTKWWWCDTCGYCSWGSYYNHQTPKHPKDLYQKSVEYFRAQRRAQGLTQEATELQIQHLCAVALRVAASLPPKEFKQYIDKHIFPKDLA